jgi:hypothetical protein
LRSLTATEMWLVSCAKPETAVNASVPANPQTLKFRFVIVVFSVLESETLLGTVERKHATRQNSFSPAQPKVIEKPWVRRVL